MAVPHFQDARSTLAHTTRLSHAQCGRQRRQRCCARSPTWSIRCQLWPNGFLRQAVWSLVSWVSSSGMACLLLLLPRVLLKVVDRACQSFDFLFHPPIGWGVHVP